jgi:hypothetical protein
MPGSIPEDGDGRYTDTFVEIAETKLHLVAWGPGGTALVGTWELHDYWRRDNPTIQALE